MQTTYIAIFVIVALCIAIFLLIKTARELGRAQQKTEDIKADLQQAKAIINAPKIPNFTTAAIINKRMRDKDK